MRTLLPLLLLLGGCGCASVPSHDELRATALRLEFQDGVCSGTAIGADSILTAVHCMASPLVRVNGQPVKLVESRKESRDRIVVKLSGIRFKHWVQRGPTPAQGDRLRFWGQPSGESDIYREAIVSRVRTDQVVLQTIVCPGDSGSGLIDAQGRVVGVVSAVTGDRVCKFGLSL
jgi:hypothetical protein